MCFLYDDEATGLRNEIRKARKPHRCDECDETIGVGHVYRSMVFKLEDRIYQHDECARCNFVRHAIFAVERSRGCEKWESWAAHGDLARAWEENDEYAIVLGLYDPADEEAEAPHLREVARW